MASLANIRAAGVVAAPPGWEIVVSDNPSEPWRIIVKIIPPADLHDVEAILAGQGAIMKAVDDMRPAGLRVDYIGPSPEEQQERAEQMPQLEVDDDFALALRRMRGDFGACAACGEPFGEGEATEPGTFGDSRVHPGCVAIGTCAGCDKPIHRREHHTSFAGSKVHTDCEERAKNLLAIRKEREAAEERQEARRLSTADLLTRAVAHARQGATVAYVEADTRVEDVARNVAGGAGLSYPQRGNVKPRIASSLSARKAIVWSDVAGCLVIECASPSKLETAKPGYVHAYVTRAAEKQCKEIRVQVALCFHLRMDQITLEGDKT